MIPTLLLIGIILGASLLVEALFPVPLLHDEQRDLEEHERYDSHTSW